MHSRKNEPEARVSGTVLYPSNREVEAKGLGAQGQPRLHETLSQINKPKRDRREGGRKGGKEGSREKESLTALYMLKRLSSREPGLHSETPSQINEQA